MRKQLQIFVSLVVLLLFIVGLSQTSFAKAKEYKFIEKNADIIIFVNNDPDDPGFSYVTNLWRERFDIKETSVKNEAITQLYSELPISTIVGAVYLPQKAFDEDKEPIYPEFIVIIEARKKQEIFKEALDVLIKKRKPLKKIKHEGHEITYRDKKLEPYHGQKDLAAYVQVGKYFVIAMSPKEIYRAIDTYEGKRESFSSNKECLKLLKKVPESDAYLLINNASSLFSKNLRRWEEMEGMRVLLSSEAISSMLFSLDLATDDSIKGELIFEPKEGEDIISIEDDACFFEEIINRSFIKEDIKWISEVETLDAQVVLSFEGTGFKKIWEEALLNKRIAFLEKERDEVTFDEEDNVQPKTALAKLIKVLFVFLVALVVLTAVILIKRKK